MGVLAMSADSERREFVDLYFSWQLLSHGDPDVRCSCIRHTCHMSTRISETVSMLVYFRLQAQSF